MIGLLAQERLILNQLVLLMKQGVVPGERVSQPRFRPPKGCEPALIARDRAAFWAFKCSDRRRVRAVRQMFNGHAVNLPRRPEVVALTTINTQRANVTVELQ